MKSKIVSFHPIFSSPFRLVVSQATKALHIVFPHQFLDSPEWFGVSTDDYFQVSITSMEEARVLIWHRDKLKLSIMTEPFLQIVFEHILSRDVVKKLMQVTQVVSTTNPSSSSSSSLSSQNTTIKDLSVFHLMQVSESMAQSNGYISSAYDDDEKPILKHPPGSGGLTALINKQLQGTHTAFWCCFIYFLECVLFFNYCHYRFSIWRKIIAFDVDSLLLLKLFRWDRSIERGEVFNVKKWSKYIFSFCMAFSINKKLVKGDLSLLFAVQTFEWFCPYPPFSSL